VQKTVSRESVRSFGCPGKGTWHMEPSGRTTRRPKLSAASVRHDRQVNPEAWTTTDQAAGLFMLGLIYALVLVWLAFRLAGAGHGSGFFLTVCIPGVVLWPAAGVALAFGHRPIGRWVGPAILIVQYLLSLDDVSSTDRADRARVAIAWSGEPWIVLVFTAVFLAGQAALWFVYAVKKREAAGGMSRGRITLVEAMIAVVILSLLLAIVTIPAGWIISLSDYSHQGG
jgi:hypothetical protein